MTHARAAASTSRNEEEPSPQNQQPSPQKKHNNDQFTYIALQVVLNEIKQYRNNISPRLIITELLKLSLKSRNASKDKIGELITDFIKKIYSEPDTSYQHGSLQS
jgi:hypothetical protein